MLKFRTASRSPEEMKDHKEKLNEIFAKVGSKGKIDRRGVKALHDNRVDVAETLVQLIDDEYAVTDPIPFLAERKPVGFTDRTIFQRLDGSLSVVTRSYGTKPLSQRLTSEEWTFNTSPKEIAVEVPLEEIAGGRITAAQVVQGMAWAIARYKVKLVLDTIDVAVQNGTGYAAGSPYGLSGAEHTGLAGYAHRYTGFTRSNFEMALDGMLDDGESPTIFGRHIGIQPTLRGFSGYSQDTIRDYEQKGQVAVFNGAPVVTLIDKFSRVLGGHQISPDRAWIAGGTKGCWLIEKDLAFLNYAFIDERSATFCTGLRLEDSAVCYDKHKYRVIART